MILRRATSVVALVALASLAAEPARGFATFGSKWRDGAVVMHLQLPPAGPLLDGAASFEEVAADAMAAWNRHLESIQFEAVKSSPVEKADGDLVNHVFFDTHYYGEPFGEHTLAVTTRWTIDGAQRVEADVVFNRAIEWNSYRGPVRTERGSDILDLRRVALHELGHVLGLDHPDEREQRVPALMNSLVGNLDTLTEDDIAGARSLYRGTAIASDAAFPSLADAHDFFARLSALYRDRLHADASPTYLPADDTIVWLAEFARNRVGLCEPGSVGDATRICARTPAGVVFLPSAAEGIDVMRALNEKYRDNLRRPPTSSFVNVEGIVVWMLEYFRYRLNGCGHPDASARVLQQVLGEGIQPVCGA